MPTATHSLDAICERAAHWVDRQFTGVLSGEELAEFELWRRADECHEECLRMSTASRWVEWMRDEDVGVSKREAFIRWALADPRNMEEFRLATVLFRGRDGRQAVACTRLP